MDDRWTRNPARLASNPLIDLAALGALGATLGRPPRRDHPRFWALTVVALVVNLVIVAVCIYALIELWNYFHSTTPCMRMGTCLPPGGR
ncbi:MAG TPA: hypothetical protein VMO88_06820 [Acidimicrobiales bacterium]|nr:hypothetical protein [Acidimicrobiales bacterium]